MKRYFVFALFTALVACNSNPGGYTVEGVVSGDLKDGSSVYLKKANEQNQPVDVDTATVTNGTFTFSGKIDKPELHYLFIDETMGNIPLVLEAGTIEVNTHKDSLAYAHIDGTLQNELFSDFLESSRALSRRALSMNEDMRDASVRRDTVVMNSLREEYFELQEEAKDFELNYARENPNALISALIIDKILTTGALPVDEIKQMYESLSPEIKDTSVGQKIKKNLEKGDNASIGSKAPNFTAPTPSGEELALHDVMGNHFGLLGRLVQTLPGRKPQCGENLQQIPRPGVIYPRRVPGPQGRRLEKGHRGRRTGLEPCLQRAVL